MARIEALSWAWVNNPAAEREDPERSEPDVALSVGTSVLRLEER